MITFANPASAMHGPSVHDPSMRCDLPRAPIRPQTNFMYRIQLKFTSSSRRSPPRAASGAHLGPLQSDTKTLKLIIRHCTRLVSFLGRPGSTRRILGLGLILTVCCVRVLCPCAVYVCCVRVLCPCAVSVCNILGLGLISTILGVSAMPRHTLCTARRGFLFGSAIIFPVTVSMLVIGACHKYWLSA